MTHPQRWLGNPPQGRPSYPPRQDEAHAARQHAEARLKHPELYANEREIPPFIVEHAPDLAEKIRILRGGK